MRVALYIRVSTDEQAQSAETQERGALVWCATHDRTVITTYRDIGHSGAEWVHRPGILDLQRDATHTPRPWDVVVVRDVDRLGRDAVRLPLLLSVLSDHGVQVVEYSTGQTLGLDGVGQLIASVRACLAQIERETIAHRVRTAHAQQHRDGRVVGGAVYGYRNVRSPEGVHYAIDPEQAAVVRRIFQHHARGDAFRTIAKALNTEHVPPPSAGGRGTGSWAPSVIHAIVRRERYRGVLAWGATAKRYKGGTRTRVEGGEVTRVEAPALAIVSEDLWHAAQAHRTEARATAGRAPRFGPRVSKHFLVGYAMCAACEGPLVVGATHQGRMTVPAYTCGWHRDRGICNASWKRWTERLDTVVREWLLRDVVDARVIEAAVYEARQRLLAREPDPRAESLRTEEREISVAIERLVTALEGGGDVPELVARLRERRARLDTVRRELTAIEAPTASPVVDVDAALALAVADLRAGLRGDVQRARAILGSVLVGRLRVSWDGPGGRVWVEGRAELGGVLRAVTGSTSASPDGLGRTTRLEFPKIAERWLRAVA